MKKSPIDVLWEEIKNNFFSVRCQGIPAAKSLQLWSKYQIDLISRMVKVTHEENIAAQAHDKATMQHSLTKQEVDALLRDCEVIDKTADKIIESDILQNILDRR